MEKQVIPVNPALLQWARQTAGLSLRDAALRAGITPPRRKKGEPSLSPEDRLLAWEHGEETPTMAQLSDIAKAYRRPLVTFFLSEPPQHVSLLADFRTVQNAAPQESPEFSALKRRIFLLHRELCAIAKEENTPNLPFVGSCKVSDGVVKIVASLRQHLGMDTGIMEEVGHGDFFTWLRDKAQQLGIYVVLMGDLGSHHTRIDPEEFRGIAIADAQVPLVVVNKNDAKAAMLFTLAHELAHLWLGASGVSNANAFASVHDHKKDEVFCNAVAAEFLVPQDALQQAWPGHTDDLPQSVKLLSRKFRVSEEVIARRLADIGIVSAAEYSELLRMYQARWHKQKEKNKGTSGGPDSNTLARYWLGHKTLTTLMRATNAGLITMQDAARTINMSASRFARVAE